MKFHTRVLGSMDNCEICGGKLQFHLIKLFLLGTSEIDRRLLISLSAQHPVSIQFAHAVKPKHPWIVAADCFVRTVALKICLIGNFSIHQKKIAIR